MQYTGTALEKLTGLAFAMLLLAIILVVVNLGAIAVAISYLETYSGALELIPLVFLILLVPLMNFAKYRSRRYILSRTTWRGIRFGMDRGALGYATRASIYGILTLLTAGLFLPVRTFLLEKYLTDRTWYGNAKFKQHGNPLKLFGPVFPLLFSIWGGVALAYLCVAQNVVRVTESGRILVDGESWYMLVAAGASIPLAMVFVVYYRVASVRVLHALKELGDGITFDIWPRTRTVVKTVYWGGVKGNMATSFVSAAISGVMWCVVWLFGIADAATIQAWAFNPPLGLLVFSVLSSAFIYLTLFNVFKHTFIVFPLVKHVAETVRIINPEGLDRIRQRSLDGRTDAGGFAEALDAGAAF